ncbi:hypothetical protein SteCoe_15793 [Stentor coeruleus]|uniref:Uncharacterized protein n=1 Tax=Stentor coeruleus TaxID=5963 RepID=A0A1R2C2Z5_9CILI|nr:hypothetical protein SteCoe_15793 [Stentor coeruleus]
MSKNQNFLVNSSLKSKSPFRKVPLKFLPKVAASSIKDLRIFYKPTYSASKSRETLILNSTNDLNKSQKFQEPEGRSYSLVKQSTGSTESYSDRHKEFISLETRLNLLNKSVVPEEEYEEVKSIWAELIKIPTPLSTILGTIKTKVEKFVVHLQRQLSECHNVICESKETEHTLKILKKRFKKLAIENLEVSNLIEERENSCFRAKEKVKKMQSKLKNQEQKSEEELKKLKSDFFEAKNEANLFKSQSLRWKIRAKCFKKVMELVKNNQGLGCELCEKIKGVTQEVMMSNKNYNILASSIDFDGDQQSLILATTVSKYNSFLSDLEMESII